MSKKLAIKGHSTRGKEVIKLLELLGGSNMYQHDGEANAYSYYISNNVILHDRLSITEDDDFEIFTLQEFLDKFPFKIHYLVNIPEYESTVDICGMRWDPYFKCVEYMVYRNDDEEWYTAEELLKYNDNPNKPIKDMKEKDKAKAPDIKGEDYSGKRFGYKIPDGYEFDRVDNGKIILKPIEPKYLKTYKECCDVLLIPSYYNLKYHTREHGYNEYATSNNLLSLQDKLNTFGKLLICRDAYWKIAGEQIGLGKPWEPDWKDETQVKYMITIFNNKLEFFSSMHSYVVGRRNHILSFPTEEMRDAFYENFKKLIESCKELL